MKYVLWRACERFNILPPNVKSDINQNTPVALAEFLAYEQLREREESSV
jgi:hypothetical protein